MQFSQGAFAHAPAHLVLLNSLVGGLSELIDAMEGEKNPAQPRPDTPGGGRIKKMGLLDDVILPFKENKEQVVLRFILWPPVHKTHYTVLKIADKNNIIHETVQDCLFHYIC